jgi:hypothetical protein
MSTTTQSGLPEEFYIGKTHSLLSASYLFSAQPILLAIVVAELLSLPSYCRCRVTVVAELLSLPSYCRCRVTVRR